MEHDRKLVVFGDIHKKWTRVNSIIGHENSIDNTFLSTGDLCNYSFEPQKDERLVFTPGNHDNYFAIKDIMEKRSRALKALLAGDLETLSDGTRIAALHGVYSPHFFQKNDQDGLSKYHTEEEVRKTSRLNGVDILLTHEAPVGVGVIKNGKDLGKEHINRLIKDLKPRVCFFGHHHGLFEGTVGDTPVYGLDMPHRSYASFNLDDYSIQISRAQKNARGSFKYEWEGQK